MKKVLRKYDVSYYRCSSCLFLQTEDPYWLGESYSSAINSSDIGLLTRNLVYLEILTSLFRICKFDPGKKYLDYGGGYGVFVRLMRDNGFNFYWSDEYCENIYATKFKSEDLPSIERKFEVITAFEVFEHLVDPMKDIKKMLETSDSIIFSNELQPDDANELKDWWYICPEHGQHTALYHKKTLEYICKKFNLNLYSYKNLHFLTKKKISNFKYKIGSNYKIARIYNTIFQPGSLQKQDYEIYLKEQSM